MTGSERALVITITHRADDDVRRQPLEKVGLDTCLNILIFTFLPPFPSARKKDSHGSNV